MSHQVSPTLRLMRQQRLWISRSLAGLMALWQIGQPLQAVDQTWNNSTSDSLWNTAGNWTSAAPTAADNVILTTPILGGLSTITLGSGSLANLLSIRDNYTLTGGDLTLTSGAVRAELGTSSTISSQLLGATGLTLTGGGSVRLTNASNGYTGTTSIRNGTLTINSEAALGGTGTVSILTTNSTPSNTSMIGFGGGSLVLDGTAGGFTLSRAINFEGRGPIGDRGAAIQSLGNNTLSGTLTSAVSPLAPATLRNSRINSVNGTLTISGTLNVGGTLGTTLTTLGGVNTAGVGNFSFAGGTIAGTGTLEKTGSGTLFLNGNAAGFTGAVRTGASSVGQQSSIRVTQTTVGGTSVFGAGSGSGASAPIDLNGGVLEFRSNSNLDFNALTTGKHVLLRASTVFYTGPAGGGDVVNGLTALGLFRVAQGQTATFRSRNGFGATLQAWSQESSNGNTGIANEMGGTLTFTGDAWNNADSGARNLTFSGNGNTRIIGNITATGTNKQLVKQGAGELAINGVAGTFTGNTSIEGGAVRITDFRSIFNGATPGAISLGNAGTTGGNLIIGGTGVGTGTVAGLTTSKPITLNTTSGSNSIYANQAGVNPVILNGAITKIAGATTGNFILGGSNTADNIVNVVIPVETTPSTGGLVKLGGGTWVLNNANTYLGATTIQGGTLKLRATAAASDVIKEAATNTVVFSNQGVTGAAGGTLEFQGVSGAVTTETLGALTPTAGAATIRLLGNGGSAANLIFNNATAALGATTAATSVNFDTTGANGGTISFTGVAPTAATATTLPGTANFQGHLYINGANFADVVAGVVTAPTYGGAGSFRDAGAALVAATHNRLTTATANGAATISSLLTNSQTLTLSGNLVVSTGGILQSGGAASILSDSATSRLIQGGAAATNVAIRVNLDTDVLNLGNATNPVNISSVTTGGLTKNGAGTLVVFGTNAQTGTTTINEGKVSLNGTAARLSATSASLVVRQGATLELLAGVTAGNAVVNAVDGAGTISGQSGQTFTQNGGGTWNGVYSGTGFNITKGGGNATWSGVSTYTGVTTIGGTGLVTVDTLANGGANSGIGASSNAASNLVFTGSTAGIDYRGSIIDNALTLGSRSATTDRLFTLAAAATGANLTSTASNNNAIIWSNTGAIVNNTTANATLTFAGTGTGLGLGDNTFNPQLVNSSVGGGVTLAVTKSGAGQWNLGSATNSYTGATTIADGVLGLNNNSALPSGSPLVLGSGATSGILQMSGSFARTLTATPTAGTGTITFGGTAGGGFAAHSTALTVTLDGGAGLTWGSGGFVPTGASLVLNSASSLADVTFTNAINLGAAARTVTVNDNGQTGSDYADMTGVLSGAGGSLVKAGGGILRLTAANSYTGNTTLTGGSLVVSSFGSSMGGATSGVGAGAVTMNDANAIILGNGGAQATGLIYVGAGEVSDRKIRLNATGTNHVNAIYADGSGPLTLTNVANDMLAGAKTLSLRGTNAAGNMITGQLTNNGADALTVNIDSGATWILTNATNSYSGATNANAGALGIGDNAALGAGTLSINNGNVFAYGADRTIANPVALVNATNGWLGEYSVTLNGLTSFNGAGNVITNNSIVDGKALTLNNGVNANSLTANRAWVMDGPGETVINGAFATSTTFGVRFDVNGGGTLNLGTNGATSNFNQGSTAADVDRGILKFSANNAIPTTFMSATPATTAGTGIGITTYTVSSTSGLVVGQPFSGTNVPAGSKILTIDSPTTFTTTIAPTAAVGSGVALTFSGSGGVTLTPELANNDTAKIDLNGTTQTFNAFTATADGISIIDNSSASAATLIVGANNTAATFGTGGTGTYSITQTGGGAINLGKVGTGTANFTGTLGNTGTVTSNGGTLNLNSATGATGAVADGGTLNFKGGFTTPGNLLSVTTDNGGLVSFASGAGTPFANLTNLNLSLTANAGLELDVGDTAIDKLTTAAASVANVTTLFIKDIDITGGNTYDLIAHAGGGLGVAGNYLLNLPGYSGSSLTVTPTLIQLNAGTLITSDVYWNNGTGLGGGALTQAWNTVDPTTTNINFSGVVAGTPALQLSENLPGKGQKVIFQADNLSGGAPLATTLEQSFTVNTLEFRPSTTPADTSRTISIAPGAVTSNSLTIKPSLSTDGINLQTGAVGTATISAPFVAGASQTWTVADAPVELVGAVISGTTTVTPTSMTGLRPGMTVSGTGIVAGTTIATVGPTSFTLSTAATDGTVNVLAAQQLNMSGAVSGAGNVVKAGAGKVVLSGSNGTLAGTYTNSVGITQVNTLSALGGLVGVPGSGTDITVSGGSFFYNGAAATFVNDITLSGGTLASGGGNQTYSGNVNVSANSGISLRDQAAANVAFGVARNVTLSGIVSGAGRINLDSVNTVSSGNQLTGTLTLSNANTGWSGGLAFNRGSVSATNVDALGTGPITASLGRITFGTAGGTTFAIPSTQTLALDGVGSVFEFTADASGTPTSDMTVNYGGAITLGSVANANVGLRLFQATDNFSVINLQGGIVLGNNASISTAGSTTRTVTIDTVGISETGGSRVLSINDDVGAWAQTNQRLAINVASTYTGGTNLAEGTLILGHKDAIGTGTLTITGASTLQASVDLSSSGSGPVPNALTLNNSLTVSGSNNLTINGITNATGADANRTITNSLTAGSLVLADNVNLGATGTTAARTLTITGTGNTEISGAIINNTAFAHVLTKTGTGTLTLSNSAGNVGGTTGNTFTGGININQGTVRATASNVLPNTGTITVNATTAGTALLDLNGNSDTIAALTLGGTGGLVTSVNQVSTGAGTLTLGGNVTVTNTGNWTTPASISGNLSVGAASRTFTVGDSSGTVIDLQVDALVSSVGAFGIVKAGAGTMLLTNTGNSYSGGTTINTGEVRTGASNVLPNSGTITLLNTTGAAAVLNLNGNSDTIAALAFGGTGGVATSVNQVITGAGTLTLGGNVSTNSTGNPTATPIITGNLALGAATRTFTVADSTGSAVDLDVQAIISGTSVGITKAGAGVLVLSNVNTYTGATTISPTAGTSFGVIRATANDALGTGAVTSVFASGATTGQIQLSGGITLSNTSFTTSGVGSDGTTNGVIRSVNGANIISGAINMTGGGGASTYRADTGSTLTFSGNVGGVGTSPSRIVNLVGGGDFVFNGIIRNANDATASTVGVNSSNTGMTTLNGVNTYTLATTVGTGSTLIAGSIQAFGIGSATTVDGTLRLAGFSNSIGSLTGAGTVENASATAAILSSSAFSGFTGLIQDGTGAGSLSITKTAAGTSTLAGTNTFSGKTTIANGTLSVATVDPTATATQPLGTNSDLDLGVAATSSGRFLYTGGAASFGKNINALGNGTDTIENGGSGLLTLTGTITKAGTTLTLNGGSSGLFVGGLIVGVPAASDLIIAGGTVTLANANTYNGPTFLNAGTLNINNVSAISTGAFNINGGTIDNTSGSAITLTTNNPLNITSNFTFTGTNSLNLGTGAVTLDANRTVTVTANTLTIGGAITGAFNLTGTGAGTLVLSGASTYTGTTTALTGTTISVGGNGALGDTSSGTVVDSGASLALNNVLYTDAEALTINGTGVGGGGAFQTTGTSSFAGSITAATNATINATGTLGLTGGLVKDGTTLTLAGSGTYNVSGTGISGASANSDLIVDAATVNLNVANTYNGPTFIRNGGVINANVTNALPTSIARTDLIMDDSGTGSSNLTLGVSQSIASLTGAASSTVALGSNTLTVGKSSGTTTFAGVISGAGNIEKDGANIQVLTGTNTFTGTTTINAGTLRISDETNLGANPSSSNPAQLTLNGGTLNTTATMAINDSNRGVTLGAGGGTFETADSTTLNLNNVITGPGALNKMGGGTLGLDNANTYTGETNVNAGTLNVTNTSGSATGSGTVTVGTSGTLAGTGKVEAAPNNYIYINGTLQVGDSTLSVAAASTLEVKTSGTGSMVLGSASIVKFDLFTGAGMGDSTAISSAADQIRLFGSLDAATNPGSTLLLTYQGAGSFVAGDMWKLFDLTGPGTISGAFNINYSGLGLGPLLAAELNNSTGVLSIVTVPEPSRALLYLIGLMGIFLRRRRR